MNIRGFIYNSLITFTSNSYTEVLERLPQNAHLLDVGVGTGKPITDNVDLIKKKAIKITGIDIDDDYLMVARTQIQKAGLFDFVAVEHANICTATLTTTYDAVYFSDSFMIIPKSDRRDVLIKASASLSKTGKRTIYFTQTHERQHSAFIAFMKPLLKWFTTIDFGQVTYEEDFIKTLSEAGLVMTERKELYTNIKRALVLIVAKPAK